MEKGKEGLKLTYAHVFGFAVTTIAIFSAFFLDVDKLQLMYNFFIEMMKKMVLIN